MKNLSQIGKRFLNRNNSFISYCVKAINSSKRSKDSIRCCLGCLNKLEHGNMFKFKDVKLKNIQILDKHLNECNYKYFYISSIHNVIRYCINRAIEDGLLKTNPYKNFNTSCPKSTEDIRYIQSSEIVKLQHTLMQNEAVCLARDLFVFQCHTGLACIDLFLLKYSDIQLHNGLKWIIGKRHKTNKSYYIPLSDVAILLIEKYKKVNNVSISLNRRETDDVFPFISTAYYNQLLKKAAKNASIKDVLTTHKGRHTFATMMLENGVSIESISKMLGHSRSQTSELYSQVTISKIKKEALNQNFFTYQRPMETN